VLGVDEHTACVIDLDEETLSVEGNGAVHVRRDGATTSFPAGTTITLDRVREAGADPGASGGGVTTFEPPASAGSGEETAPAPAGLLEDATRHHDAFAAAVDDRDVEAAVAAVLGTEQALVDWSADTLQSDEPDRARALLREMVVRLGELARVGAQDPREVVGPFVEAVLDARDRAREARDWAAADALRDRLVDAGVEIHDTPDGTTWDLR
jgi:cysteinyl-tRNA synthetase